MQRLRTYRPRLKSYLKSWPIVINLLDGTSRRATFGEVKAYARGRICYTPIVAWRRD